MTGTFGKGLLSLGWVLLALLLLSALVEGPLPEEAETLPTLGVALLAPADVPTPMPGLADAGLSRQACGEAAPVERPFQWQSPGPACQDANGRVVRTARYTSSAYQLFRQEAACG